MIEHFLEGKTSKLFFEGQENEQTGEQLKLFSNELRKQSQNSYLKDFDSWHEAFDYLTENIFRRKKQKHILVLDELQWLAAGQSKLISLIKLYWDRYWQKQNVMLVLCGSMASFMVKKVIFSKALYGRISSSILLQALKPNQATLFFSNKRSKEKD